MCTYIYGIGRTSAIRILADAGVDPDTRVRDLTQDDVKKISEVIDETQVVEGDLRREIQLNIKRLKEIGCYRGIRHRKGLPVRGQKTKTNAHRRHRTDRGCPAALCFNFTTGSGATSHFDFPSC